HLIFLLSVLAILTENSLRQGLQVTGLLGGSVTVKCYYPRTSVNRHDRKYWCKESRSQCVTIISSSGYTAQDFSGRATITDFPEQGIFTIEISKLVEKDTSFYKCGIGLNDRGLSFKVKLDVSKGPNVPEEAELYYIELGGSVTINCVFGTEYGSERKYMCRMGKTGCSNVIDTYGNVNENYKGRVLLSLQEPAGSFSLYMTQLRKEDSGVYLCGAGIYGEKGESKELDIHVYQGEQLAGCVDFSHSKSEEINILFPKDLKSPPHLTPPPSDTSFALFTSEQVFNFVSPETSVPQGPHVINGVIGGSVSVECHYDPRGNYTLKYWCKWRKNGCNQLITNLATMIDSYEGRIVLHDNPENGTFTVIMNQLTAEDAGYYWCITDGETERKSTKELKIIDGQPGLTGAKEIDAVIGTRVTIPCSYPCKYYSYQKYWCKWHNTGCQSLISSEQNQTGLVVNCDKEKRTLYLTFDQVIQTDQGWYWCGVSHSGHYGETMAVYLTVNGGELQHLLQDKTGKVFPVAMMVHKDHTCVLLNCSLSSSQEHDSSKVILSVLLPIAVVCLLLATVFVVVKFRLLKRTDLVSVGSYRTNISMSEFENSRDYGAKDNMGINDAQETQLGGVDVLTILNAKSCIHHE
uniref:Polymeric immunoglobulin receptor n=1 Tax=Gopherus evgoodei TaxID=1825980 RepID=A0A8C4VKQ3_9SAUR